MKRLLLTTSLAVLALSSPLAFADSGKHQKQVKHAKHHENRDDDRRGDDRRHREDRDDDRHEGRHDNGRHLGWQKQAFRRGERVPVVYLEPRYYVEDYRAYQLAPPPRGYRWVRPDDGRYLLIQTATGVISQILGY